MEVKCWGSFAFSVIIRDTVVNFAFDTVCLNNFVAVYVFSNSYSTESANSLT
jgi:hypothetical protein